MKHSYKLGAVSICLAVVLAACSQGGTDSAKEGVKKSENESAAPVVTEKANLDVFVMNSITDDEIKRLWVDPLSKKYPHITLTISRVASGGAGLSKELAGGHKPDLIFYNPYMQDLLEIDIPLDLRELMKKHKISLAGFDKQITDAIQGFGPKGEVYAIPFVQNAFLTLYNKSLFDKFGQAYPKDGMTWADAIEVTKKMSRSDNGIQYRGIEPLVIGGIHRLAFPMSIKYMDAAQNKAYIDPKWKSLFQLAMDIYAIPNNRPEKLGDPANDFFKNQTLAMWPGYTTHVMNQLKALTTMEWDMVQYPSFPDYPNLAIMTDFNNFIISKTSKYPDQAMQAISVFVSDQVQADSARTGRIPAASSKVDLTKEFAADVAVLKGKNLPAIFKSKSAPFAPSHEYDLHVRNEILNAFSSVFAGTADINTALRAAEEKANQKIAEEMQKKK
ncbi:MAG: extracellular solute-binding protein family 1 [Paenibacillus sp.]|jgi:multiple sugar transport system substrate-binding protein|nr:extracellular solute-binding protein family 1 [Paenibacillus sp.]